MTPHVRRMVGELNAGSMLTLVTGSDEKPLTGWTPRPIVKFIFDFFCSCNDDLIEEMNHSWGHLNRPLYIIYHNCIPLSECFSKDIYFYHFFLLIFGPLCLQQNGVIRSVATWRVWYTFCLNLHFWSHMI